MNKNKIILALFWSFILFFPIKLFAVNGDYTIEKQAVLQLSCYFPENNMQSFGSAVLLNDKGYFITNAHVVENADSDFACVAKTITDLNLFEANAEFNVDVFYIDPDADFAIGKYDKSLDGQENYLRNSYDPSSLAYLNLEFQAVRGENIWLFGYPAITKGSFNITEGNILYKDQLGSYNYLFTDAIAFQGNSGGAMVNNQDKLLGIVTSLNTDENITNVLDIDILYRERDKLLALNDLDDNELEALDFIQSILKANNAELEATELYPDLQGRCIDNSIKIDDNKCLCIDGYVFYNDKCVSYNDACKYWYGEHSYFTGNKELTSSESVNLSCACEENYQFNDDITACVAINEDKIYDLELSKRLAGYLLLQVEKHGEIWYVDTEEYKKHEIKQSNVLDIFRSLSLGISNRDLSKLFFDPNNLSDEKDSDADGYSDQEEILNNYNLFFKNEKYIIDWDLVNRLKGKLLLQVEDHGRIWYEDPKTLKLYEIKLSNFMEIFRSLSLGISDENLNKIK